MLGKNQLWKILDALCVRSGLSSRGVRWKGPGDGTPSKEAIQANAGKLGCSTCERLLVQIAFDIFNGHGNAPFDKLLLFDGANLRMVGELLTALGDENGARAAEVWLAKWGATTREGGAS